MGCQSVEKTKPKYRKGLWSPEEDNKLRNYILKHGHGCWSSVPIKAALQRNGKSCRLRWINYLRPGLKRGVFSKHEEDTIMTLHLMLGNKWSKISQHLAGRTDNEIKNYWHSYLKKKVLKPHEIEPHNQIQHASSSSDTLDSSLSTQTLSTHQDPNNGLILLENMEKTAAQYSDHSLSQNYNLAKDASQSILPKLLFAEWLLVDHVNAGGSSVNSDDSLVNGFDQTSTFQEPVMHLSQGHFGGEFHDSLIHSSASEVYNSRLNLQTQVDENDYVHYIPGGDLCNNFTLSNDSMYV